MLYSIQGPVHAPLKTVLYFDVFSDDRLMKRIDLRHHTPHPAVVSEVQQVRNSIFHQAVDVIDKNPFVLGKLVEVFEIAGFEGLPFMLLQQDEL